MFIVRPVESSDVPVLEELAAGVTPGVHTLPRTRKTLEHAVERSSASFAAHPEMPDQESYFFVMEAPDKTIAGTAALFSAAGDSSPFFVFRNDVIHQVSRDLDISHNVHALTLCSDLTGYSQLSSFYLRECHRTTAQAQLLSRARLLFAAVAPHRFNEKFFAAMAGITNAKGCSPFWDAIGRKFFQMDFLEAERLIEGARNRTLIVELMPHYPVYVPLLPGDAQAAMGQVHVEGELAFRILSGEGFEPDEYIDLFDGGPVLRAHKKTLRSFSRSMLRHVASLPDTDDALSNSYLVATARDENFRVTLVECAGLEMSDRISLPQHVRQTLDVTDGDAVLCVKL